jgi:fucose permease
MATRTEATVVYAAGAAQGIVLVTFPAASTIFTNPTQYGLSTTEYGTLFLPQVVTAITGALLGAWLSRRYGVKPVYLAGLAFGLVAMALLLASTLVMTDKPVAYGMLLLATASLGAGFGLTVPAVNSLTAAFHPDGVDRSVLVLNALLGVGTTLAPVLVAIFVGLGFWWGLPLTSLLLLVVLVVISVRLPLRAGAGAVVDRTDAVRTASGHSPVKAGIPARFWLFGVFAVLYGACETVNGNWAQLDMTSGLGASTMLAALALTAFWAMVTVGRVIFAALQRRFSPRYAFHFLPFALAGVFLLLSVLRRGETTVGIVLFGLAGLACSALLPLTISFGQEEFTAFSASAAGGVIAAYQLGYGIAAFGVGPLVDAGVPLHRVYGTAAAVAVGMGLLSFAVARSDKTVTVSTRVSVR